MLKRKEIEDPQSCLNKAADDEPVFVLRAKDPVAIAVVLDWIERRVSRGIDSASDPKLQEAFAWCEIAENWRKEFVKATANPCKCGHPD